ncbi:PREDICTED: uncharacterized protein LOC105119270 [Populus euphratica]|uniref:Uncharacterized protein LOC105119270 n=1 Tax=Populus euphratica TaxID=75702 RepID=A0AAJ6TRI3_POPEU|nr:PREDICTED: uncharacterized protein LOC105119270 [Populus euphratica]
MEVYALHFLSSHLPSFPNNERWWWCGGTGVGDRVIGWCWWNGGGSFEGGGVLGAGSGVVMVVEIFTSCDIISCFQQILLAARHIYPNLSKLALALEKNLLVTSTLAVCTDPYPQALEKPGESDKPSEELQVQSSLVQNGVEPVVGDGDEIMSEVEEADIDDDMTIDMEALEEIVASSETNSPSTGKS